MIWHTFKQHSNTFFLPPYKPRGHFKARISKCSMMPEWHQLVPLSGHVEDSETEKNKQSKTKQNKNRTKQKNKTKKKNKTKQNKQTNKQTNYAQLPGQI